MNNNILNFDGKSTYVDVPGLESPSNNGATTVEFWNYVKSSDVQSSFAFSFRTDDEHKRTSCHAPWADKKLYWDCGDWKTNGRLSVDYTQYLDKWTHIALVSAGANAKSPYMAIYINGELVDKQDTSEGPAKPLGGLVIGTDTEYSEKDYHKGMIDKFRVWNQVRSQDEIKSNMYVELTDPQPGLVTCFNFNVEDTPELKNIVPDKPNGKLFNFSSEDGEKWVNVFPISTASNPADCFSYRYIDDNGNFQQFNEPGSERMTTGEELKSWLVNEAGQSKLSLTLNTTDHPVGQIYGIPLKPSQFWVQINKTKNNVIVQFTAPKSGIYSYRGDWEALQTQGAIRIGTQFKNETGGGGAISGIPTPTDLKNSLLGVRGGSVALDSGDWIKFVVGCLDDTVLQHIGLSIVVTSPA